MAWLGDMAVGNGRVGVTDSIRVCLSTEVHVPIDAIMPAAVLVLAVAVLLAAAGWGYRRWKG